MAAETWPLLDRAPPLGPGDVHVWRMSLNCAEPTLRQMESLLAPVERQRADRFRFPGDRRRFVIGRGRVRALLGAYLGLAPAAIALNATPFGKPYIADLPPAGLRFNVAHSEDVALLAVSHGREVGVDIERERPDVDCSELAQRFFAPEEVAALAALRVAEQMPAFYRCWTRKEAYVKALGLGMQAPLDGFAVTVAAESASLIHTAHNPAQRDRWELRGLFPLSGFAAAIAVEGRDWRLSPAEFAGFL
jgi:4'-phosphopantetheinyl transferase